MNIVLVGKERKLTISSENQDTKVKQFLRWLNEYPHYINCSDDVYHFNNDHYISSAYLKAKKIKLIVDYQC